MQGRVPQFQNNQMSVRWNNQMQQIFPNQKVAQLSNVKLPSQPLVVSENPYNVKSPLVQKLPYTEPNQLEFIERKNGPDKVVAVIVTISEGISYDDLFTETKQKSQPGTQIVVATATEKMLQHIYLRYAVPNVNKIDPPNVTELCVFLRMVEPDCVLINFECCSDYANRNFKVKHCLTYIGELLKKGFMIMFSDFSLKCLFKAWDEIWLGKNPFIMNKKGYNGKKVTLNFNPESLKKSPSAQLQLLGSLSEEGKCSVGTQSDTIIYSVNREKVDNKSYTLEILTQAVLQSGQKAIGHALLTYPSGGKILTSMTHWCELQNIKTTEEKVLEAAKINMGATYVQQMKVKMANQTPAMNQRFIQQTAQQIIQQSAPCNNMVQKRNYK